MSLSSMFRHVTSHSRKHRDRRSRRRAARKNRRFTTLRVESLETRLLLSRWGAVAPEFQVHTATADEQVNAVAAMDADGDSVVVWQSNHSGDWDIYGQRFDAAALPQGAEFRINTTIIGQQENPAVAMDADGNFVVVWSGSDGMLAQRFDALGNPLGGEITTGLASADSRPPVAMDADGDFVVAWSDLNGIYVQRFNSAGAPDGGQDQVNSTPHFGIEAPRTDVAMDPDGDFVVTWSRDSYYYAYDGDIFARRFDAATEAWDAEFQINTNPNGYEPHPAVAMDADGDFVITWLSDDYSGYGPYHNVIARRYDAEGVAQGDEFQVNGINAIDSLNATVAMDADGDFVVVWESSYWENENPTLVREFAIVARRYDSGGDPVASEFLANPDEHYWVANPTVASDDDGNFVVVWETDLDPDGSSGIYGQRFVPFSAVGPEFQVNTTIVNDQTDPAVAMDADGNFVAVWQSYHSGDSDIYAQRFDAGGTPQGAGLRVNTTIAGSQSNAAVAMDADGDFVVAWQSPQDLDGSLGICAQRYNSAGVADGGEFQVNITTDDDQSRPMVAMDDDGDFVIAWQSVTETYYHSYSGQEGSYRDVFARRYDAAGASQGDEFLVNTTTDLDQSNPAVAMDPDGDFIVTWNSTTSQEYSYYYGFTNYEDIFARRYSADGQSQDIEEFQVNTDAATSWDHQIKPTVAMDSDGDFVIAWMSASYDIERSLTEPPDTVARRYNAAGAAQGDEFRVNLNPAETPGWVYPNGPQVAMDADGDFVVVWESYYFDAQYSPEPPDRSDIAAQRYDADGSPIGSNFLVNTEMGGEEWHPDAAISADGDFIVVWQSDQTDDYDVYAQRFEDLRPVAGDDDNDGVLSDVEDGAPNGGDGDSDGIADAQQSNVSSLPNAVDQQYVTLASPDGTTFSNVVAVENPSPGDSPPDVEFPVGFFEYTLDNVSPGGSTTVTQILPPGESVDTYYKYGPTPGNPTDHWYEFLYDGSTGAEVLADRVILHFVDGQLGDDDLTANGVIVEPGGPGILNTAPLAVDDAYEMYGDTLTIAASGVLQNDSDTEDDALSAVLVDPPSEGTVTLDSDGSFTYMLGATFDGRDSFTYKASDGALESNVATVNITHMLYVRNADDAGEGSLRWAVDNANSHVGLDTIRFAIGAGGPQTIQMSSPMSSIVDPVRIDGTSQPGFAGAPIVTLDAAGVGDQNVVTVAADDCVIQWLTVASAQRTGLLLSGSNRTTVSHVDLSWSGATASGYGLWLDGSSNNTIENITATNRGEGIHLFSSSDNVIRQNDLTGATNVGISLVWDCDDNIIEGNTVNSSSRGVWVQQNSDGNTIRDNDLSGNNRGIVIGGGLGSRVLNNDLSNSISRAVYISQDHLFEIAGNSFTGSERGLELAQMDSISLTPADVDLTGISERALFLHDVTNSTVSGLDLSWSGATANGYGLWLDGSSNNTIENITATNRGEGIHLYSSSDNVIRQSDLTGATNVGISLVWDCDDNIIEGNTVNSSSRGVWVQQNSDGNTIRDNDLSGNNRGIVIGGGLGSRVLNNDLSNSISRAVYISQDHLFEIAGNSFTGSERGLELAQMDSISLTPADVDLTGISERALFLHDVTNSTVSGLDLSWSGATANGYGLWLDGSSNNTIENITATNRGEGIHLYSSSDNVIRQSDLTGATNVGISLDWECDNNIIEGNTVTDGHRGVWLQRDSTGNAIRDNNLSSNSSYGILIAGGCNDNLAFNNTLAHNAVGIYVGGVSTGIRLQGNAIFGSAGLGIDLGGDGVTLNDPGDADTGANNLQNFPVLAAVDGGPATRVQGSLNSTADTTFTLDIYANTVANPSGYGEGERWLGSTTVTTDASGNIDFDIDLAAASAVGEFITATATDPDGNTSEFSAVLEITNTPPTADANGPYTEVEGSPVTFDASASSDPDNDPLQYRWDFNGDGTWDTAYSPDPTAEYTWADDYSGSVTVEVSDGQASDTDATTLTVNNVAPTLSVDTTAVVIGEGGSASKSITTGDVPADTVSVAASIGALSGSGDNWTWSYTAADDLATTPVTITATDEDGGVTTATFDLTVNNVAPSLAVTGVTGVDQGVSFDISGAFTDPGFTDVLSGTTESFTVSVDWDDNSPPDIVTPSVTQGSPGTLTSGVFTAGHTYLVPGNFIVTVTLADDDGGLATATFAVTVDRSIFILNDSISGALNMSGNALIDVPGGVFVNSAHAKAINMTGNASVAASTVEVVGGVKLRGNATISPAPTTGIDPLSDPLASLVAPDPATLVDRGAFSCSNDGTHTLLPGVYDHIRASGNCSVVMTAGIYFIDDRDLKVTGNASMTGEGIMIYHAGSKSIKLDGNGQFDLSPPDDGYYKSVLIFQDRGNTEKISLSGNAVASSVTGTIYAAAAQLQLSGNAHIEASIVVGRLKSSGNAENRLQAIDSGEVSAGALLSEGQLVVSDVTVSFEDHSGSVTTDQQQRFQAAIDTLNVAFAMNGVNLVQVSGEEETFADVRILVDTTSACGGAAEGVLGCTTTEGVITLIDGWDWYTGADTSAIGADRYDFQTIVTHELGHSIGLHHSAAIDSVMNSYLWAGEARRDISDADLALFALEDGHDYGGPEALRAAPLAKDHHVEFEHGHDEHHAEPLDASRHLYEAYDLPEPQRSAFDPTYQILAYPPVKYVDTEQSREVRGAPTLDADFLDQLDITGRARRDVAAPDGNSISMPVTQDAHRAAAVDEIFSRAARDGDYQEPDESDLLLGEQANLQVDAVTGGLRPILL